MEKAILIPNVEDLKFVNEDYRRIYFGNEFCERRIPDIKSIEKVMEFCRNKGLLFTLVTPYVTDRGLDQVKKIVKHFRKIYLDMEIVVNDLGVLREIINTGSDYGLVLGRLLSRQKRGPRILSVQDRLPPQLKRYYSNCMISSDKTKKFLSSCGIKRVEFDNVLQGLDFDLKTSEIEWSGSLYYPYVFISTTRYCVTALCNQNNKDNFTGVVPCRQECRNYYFRLDHPGMPVPLLLSGNTQFFINNKIPENIESLGIDRLVFQPKLPF